MPAVRVNVPRPSEARPPNALPLPKLESGLPQSPLMVIPVPPFGLFHTGIPSHCAAAGAVTNAAKARHIAARFISPLVEKESTGPGRPAPRTTRQTVERPARRVNRVSL